MSASIPTFACSLRTPVGASVLVAIDCACGRVFGLGGNVGEAEGVAIDRGVVPGYVLQPDRVVGRDFVEVGGIDVAIFGELALVPAGAEDPFAGFGDCRTGLDAADDLGDACGVGQLDVVELVDASILIVAVGVDESGSGGSAVEVEDLGVRVGEGENLLFGADGDDCAVADGESFGDGVFGVDSQEGSVDEDYVGFCRLVERGRWKWEAVEQPGTRTPCGAELSRSQEPLLVIGDLQLGESYHTVLAATTYDLGIQGCMEW